MHDEGIVENAARLGARSSAPAWPRLAERAPSVGEVRGTGAFWALELVADQETREPLAPYGGSSDAMNAARRGVQEAWACCRSPTTTASTWCRPSTSATRTPAAASAVIDEALAVADAAVTG